MKDLPALLTALAGFVSACGWAYSQVRVRRVVNRTHDAVGPANGADLQNLVGQVLRLDGYTHQSVHELRGKVGVVTAVVPQLLDRLESIETAIKERTP